MDTDRQLSEQFHTQFQVKHFELVARLDDTAISSNPALLQDITLEVAKLRKELTDATAFLPSYDQRQYELKLKQLEESLQKSRTSVAPKARFAFKRKTNANVASPSAPSTHFATSVPDTASPSSVPSAGLSLSSLSHQYVTLSSLDFKNVTASDLTISDIDHCIVNLLPESNPTGAILSLQITALHIRNVRNSLLMLPKVEGSALLHDVSRSVIILGCHQFRMHTSSDIDVFISVPSNPIIEHCTAVRFSGYPPDLRSMAVLEDAPQLQLSHNNLAVQDFSHIRASPSPNWSLLPTDHVKASVPWIVLLQSARAGVDPILDSLFP